MASGKSKIKNQKSKILYLDPFSGIAGDMFLGALLDLGLDLARLHQELARLKLEGYGIRAERVMRGPISATRFEVTGATPAGDHAPVGRAAGSPYAEHTHSRTHAQNYAGTAVWAGQRGAHAHRCCADILELISASGLSARVKASSTSVFTKLAEAEGKVHNRPPKEIAFHEVGALDSIVDIVGACIGLELLGVEEVWCGPVALGSGTVKCAHGLLPVPAPATLELMRGVPLRHTPIEEELTTPTGAALLAALATRFEAAPEMTVEAIGYGAGSRSAQAMPNVLRALLGTPGSTGVSPVTHGQHAHATADTVLEIRTNLDDVSPETLGYVAEKLLALGALDVFFTPIQMKKSRPATMLTVLAEPSQLDAVAAVLFRECGTFGLRFSQQSRLKLARRIVPVTTEYGLVRVKVGEWQGEVVSIHPEADDCRARAEEKGVALRAVTDAARAAYTSAASDTRRGGVQR